MLKITKGLKKKKKGKKSKKGKDEELFTQEELEAYRQQQAAKGENSGVADDEWKKFQALTADIDSVLHKTQDDLDRIKSTSFFQRVPPASEKKKAEELKRKQEELEKQQQEIDESKLSVPNPGIVELSETESEGDDAGEEDDIFDTSFLDAVESGEIKLAYIPESPVEEEAGGDDPFDTSIAERAILGPAVYKKGKKLVPLGAAVEVLTGRVELPTCAIARKPSPRRTFQQQRDLLLGSFDDNGNSQESTVEKAAPVEQPKSLLDDDEIPFDAPINLSGPSLLQTVEENKENEHTTETKPKDILSEFDVIAKQAEEEDDEFALLAAESASKTVTVLQELPIEVPVELPVEFEVEFEPSQDIPGLDEDNFDEDADPFDTTFADNILPGKAELKLIENEILNTETKLENVEAKYNNLILSKVSIHVTNPTGERESISSLDRCDESSLNSIQPIHRDLLGGSNTDLSKIGDEPIVPDTTAQEESFSDYSDPFDTSSVDQISAPGQAELKFLEKELLGEAELTRTLSDPDFNPRENEPESEKPLHRPDILDVQPKAVKFITPTPPDLLGTGEEEHGKYSKPLTPYYVRENSIPECTTLDEEDEVDPFDTSFVTELAPGKAELKLLENEFVGQAPEPKRKLSDPDFDPRGEESKSTVQVQPVQVVNKPKVPELPLVLPKPDLLGVGEDEVTAKVLTPAAEISVDFENIAYSDPFDTSIACNILPGKAELKLLENELISEVPIKRNLTDPEFDPRNLVENTTTAPTTQNTLQPQNIEDIFGGTEDQNIAKPLTPFSDDTVKFTVGDEDITDDIDPFDTSIADNIAPGKAELKLLESELI